MINHSAQLLRVFVDREGKFGDLASVVIDEGKKIPDNKRQEMAKELATGETIFINNIEQAKMSVVHPQGEIDFAGVGVLGAAWYLTKLKGEPVHTLPGRNSEIVFWQEGEINWIRAKQENMPSWNFRQVVSAREVEEMNVEYTKDIVHTMVWAWIDQERGQIRARTFANDWDIPEAEGNGSGAMVLAGELKRKIKLVHGKGSIMYARPEKDNFVELGGRIVADLTKRI